MKKTRVIFGAAALMFAFASAFAIKVAPLPDQGYLDENNQCIQASATCNGVTQDCKALIGGVQRDIRERVGSVCGEIQKMQ